MSRAPSVLELVFSMLVFVITSAAVLVPAWRRSRRATSVFRVLEFLPALPMVFVSARTGWDTARDATAHNLWPLEFAMFGVLSVVLYGAVTISRRVVERRAAVRALGQRGPEGALGSERGLDKAAAEYARTGVKHD